MDPNVPAGAALLLAEIYRIETGRAGREAYDVVYGHKQGRLPKPITSMTVGEVIAAQVGWSKAHGSSAAGAPQFIRKTLQGLVTEMGIPNDALFSPGLQDRLAYRLLLRRGYREFVAGQINRVEFGKRLAMEWASFPVLANTRGAHRDVNRGQSYYAGDGLNKSLVKPEAVEALLDRVKAAASALPLQPVPQTPQPSPAPIPVETLPAPPDKAGAPWWVTLMFIAAIAAIVTFGIVAGG
jgi:muramidase (phage lysozyme)